jgi:hypothetical protein
MSLPLAMQTFSEAEIPSGVPYLIPDAERVAFWQENLDPTFKHRVGLVWRGNPNHTNDLNRSMPLVSWLPIITTHPATQFVTLQKDLTDEERALLSTLPNVLMLDTALIDFDESAAVMMNLDVIISVDSSPAHLAGALGRKIWIPLCFAAEWRWMINRDDSPWYPTATIFRQSTAGVWDDVVQAINLKLTALCQGKTQRKTKRKRGGHVHG